MRTAVELKEELYNEIKNINLDECFRPSEKVVRIAHEVFDLIPEKYFIDDVDTGISGYGSVDLEWCIDHGVRFSIIVENRPRLDEVNADGTPKQMISYAWSNRGDRGTGKCEWSGKIPHSLLLLLDWVMEEFPGE